MENLVMVSYCSSNITCNVSPYENTPGILWSLAYYLLHIGYWIMSYFHHQALTPSPLPPKSELNSRYVQLKTKKFPPQKYFVLWTFCLFQSSPPLLPTIHTTPNISSFQSTSFIGYSFRISVPWIFSMILKTILPGIIRLRKQRNVCCAKSEE